MPTTLSFKSSSSSIKSRSSRASSARHILATEGYDASQAYMQAQRDQDAANDKAEAERLARKAALYARARRVVNATLHVFKRI